MGHLKDGAGHALFLGLALDLRQVAADVISDLLLAGDLALAWRPGVCPPDVIRLDDGQHRHLRTGVASEGNAAFDRRGRQKRTVRRNKDVSEHATSAVRSY